MPQENQRLETRRGDAEKPAFRTRLPPVLTFSTHYRLECQKVPRLPRKTTTCLETFEKDKFASFPYRHGDATGKPATRDKTRGCRKTSISYETSGNFHSWQHDKRTSFAASPIDTATPRENQTRETRQVFLRTWKFATSKSMFRARLPSIFSTCHKMPRLPRNLHLVATWRSPANAIYKNTQHHTSKVLRLPRKMTMDTSKVLRLPRKLQHIFCKRNKSIAPATQNDFRHVPEHVWMSRSATPATRNEATRRLKPPKRTTSAKLPIGTAIRSSHERLRTVADAEATSSEHTLNPQTPRVKREPLLRIREYKIFLHHELFWSGQGFCSTSSGSPISSVAPAVCQGS